MTTFVVRPHPTKNKALVTPVNSLAHMVKLLKEHPKAITQEMLPKKNISSGEDVHVQAFA